MKFSLSQLTKGYIITPPKFLSYVVGLTFAPKESIVTKLFYLIKIILSVLQ